MAVLVIMLAAGFAMFLAPPAHASSDPSIARSAASSCVYTVSPCGTTLSVVLAVTRGDTIVVWTSFYPRCSTPESISVSDSAGDYYANIVNNGFQFAACTPPGALALDFQSSYYSTANSSATVTVTVSYTTAPYEADLIVDDVSGGYYVGYEVALCNGSEASPCMPNGGGSFGVSAFVASSNSIIIAYGSASSDSTALENPLSAGPGYVTDEGPVYPGGYMLDSLTEYSTTSEPTTSPIVTSTPTDGWGEIAIVLSPMSPVTVTQTVTLYVSLSVTQTVTQTVVIANTVTSYSTVTQTATVPVTLTATSTVTSTTTVTSTPPDYIRGIGNDTLFLSVVVLIAAIMISIAQVRAAGRRT